MYVHAPIRMTYVHACSTLYAGAQHLSPIIVKWYVLPGYDPWIMPSLILRGCGVIIDRDYRGLIVAHKAPIAYACEQISATRKSRL